MRTTTRRRSAGRTGASSTVVESSGSGTAARLAAQGCRYRLLVRGLGGRALVDDVRVVDRIDRPRCDGPRPDALREAAGWTRRSRAIVSNTTEAGYGRADASRRGSAKLLEPRARAGLPGITILPCELVERNGSGLRELVLRDAEGATCR